MKESVTILKLTNGESIIGKIVESEDFFNDTKDYRYIFAIKIYAQTKGDREWVC